MIGNFFSLNYDLCKKIHCKGVVCRSEVIGFGFCFLVFLSAEVVIKESCPSGFFLEAHLDNEQRIKEISFSDGSRVYYEYEDRKLCRIVRCDSLGRELYAQTCEWSGSKLKSQTGWFTTQYTYDGSYDRVSAKFNPWYQATIEYDLSGKAIRIGDKTYSYDGLGQITSEQGYFQAAYDETFNLVELNGWSITIEEQNKLAGCNYDSRGNLLKEGFVYDDNNQLIKAGGEDYSYDSYGRLIQKGNTSYLYLGCDEIASFENKQCKTLKIPGIGGPVAIEIDGKPYARGLIIKLVDPVTNSIYRENDCDIFGGGLSDAIPYAYRGKRYDPMTGLIYFGRRYYDPGSHRWLTPDPLGPIDHENLYQYIYNNPLLYCDPTGGSFWGYVLGIGEIVTGGAIMVGGIGLEFATLGGFTFGFTVVEGAGFALMTDGLTRATRESQDLQLPKWNNRYEHRVSKRGSIDPTLPLNPDDLLKKPGWEEISHPEAKEKGHRTFENEKTGERLRHDKGKSWETGHKAHDHYHRPNPNATGKHDEYLDGEGSPTRDQSDPSHIYSPEGVWWNL